MGQKLDTIENSSEIHPETFVLCAIASLRLCVIVFQFNAKGAETRRVLSIAVFTSFVLLYIQLTIDGNHWISRQCQKLLEYG